MKDPIGKSDFDGHRQRLRHVFDRRVEAKYGDIFQMSLTPARDGRAYITLQRNASTVDAIDDFDRQAVCAVLLNTTQKQILCTYVESWTDAGRGKWLFNSSSLILFLAFDHEDVAVTKQIFRLEWDNWPIHESPNTAAYPHWQFDRWLTASDPQLLETLRKGFIPSETGEIFRSAEEELRRERPDLGWFTKIHFPAIAPWAASPIVTLDNAVQSHRSVPRSTREIENWLDSALCYLKSELTAYAVYG